MDDEDGIHRWRLRGEGGRLGKETRETDIEEKRVARGKERRLDATKILVPCRGGAR